MTNHSAFRGEVQSDFKDRPEGVRVKHAAGANSVKVYDKQGRILRVETTINDPSRWKVWRPLEGAPQGPCDWRPMRKGVADLYRRAQVSQGSNERYLDALASVDTTTSVGALSRNVCRPTRWKGRRVRALRPWSCEDRRLMQAVCRGELGIEGFRNRDLAPFLIDGRPSTDPPERRRQSARVTRQLRLLRAHGLIKKRPRSHRYVVTAKGREVMTALLTCHNVTLEQLNRAVA